MKVISQEGNRYLLRFDPGEDVLASLKDFCREYEVFGGFFSGIGAICDLELAFYDLEEKKYRVERFEEDLEIVSLSGNVSVKDAERIIHAHGSFADENFEVIGGHVKKLVVSATCELMLENVGDRFVREYQPNLGLNLLS